MKKIAIALMCTILATGAAMAQKQFTFGPKIGVDYTHYWGEDVNHGGQLNYQAGLFMEYRFTNKFSIAPEVVFAAQGGKDVKCEVYQGKNSKAIRSHYVNKTEQGDQYVLFYLIISICGIQKSFFCICCSKICKFRE